MFQPSRGCVTCVKRGGSGNQNGYEIEGLDTSGCPPILINGVSPSDSDVAQPVSTMGGQKFVYVFGSAIGDVQISGTAMLGKNASADTMERVVRFVKSRRLSSGNSEPVNVAFPGGVLKVWVTGMGLGSADPEFNTQAFVIIGLIAEPP